MQTVIFQIFITLLSAFGGIFIVNHLWIKSLNRNRLNAFISSLVPVTLMALSFKTGQHPWMRDFCSLVGSLTAGFFYFCFCKSLFQINAAKELSWD